MNRDTLEQDPCNTCGYEEGSIYCKEHCPHEANIEQEPKTGHCKEHIDSLIDAMYEHSKNTICLTQEAYADFCLSASKWNELQTCEDAISRQAVLDYIYNDLGLGDEENGKDVERQMELDSSYRYIKSLSPVIPQKIGHWNKFKRIQGGIEETWYECSECKWDNALLLPRNYCPNCGAKMSEISTGSKSENKE